MVPLIGGAHCGDHNFQARPGARAAGIRPGDDALEQWSPTFLARGADFMEDNFSISACNFMQIKPLLFTPHNLFKSLFCFLILLLPKVEV